ncbi:nicotinate (nicotinamide) nucleotide adenylyltransferase [Parasediminibacterium sp. JCM 36343]|uniref:nicotinate (nicotinamide) nucleotide adenylyltransferase n=1 Tax=Parasediminibacterium sp. JCM 36343 TaxID=3374279 RepID=UPI00397CA6E6
MKIGLYFGSFNPIHIGHLIIANHVANFTDVDQVWLVISPQNPLKPSHHLLNEYHRLHLVQKAVEGNKLLKASDVEFKLPKPSYTIDTLIYLQEKYPLHDFNIVMGSDSFLNINNWKNAQILLANYPFIVYNRPGFSVNNSINVKKGLKILDAPLLEISATAIRSRIKDGKSIQYLVSDIVNHEIIENGYYK